MRTVVVLGSTGSIGRNTLDICAAFPDKFSIAALTAAQNTDLLAQQILAFQPQLAVVRGALEAVELRRKLGSQAPRNLEIIFGDEGYLEAAVWPEAQIVVSAIVGAAGLAPTWAAVKAGKRVALANKEALVLGGELIIPQVRQNNSEILPVDSEHSAIFQVLNGRAASEEVRRLILTASGGPFRGLKKKDLALVTADQALNHPRWKMGPKVSCDSATLMNKGLELIEAHHLFGLPYERLSVVVHPQSLVHSLVEFIDGSQLAQMGLTDMRLPISYALGYPKRLPLADRPSCDKDGWPYLDLPAVSPLTFEEPDLETFPALSLALWAGRQRGTAPAILNGANEEAVAAFLAGRISFLQLPQVVEETLNQLPSKPISELADIWEADFQARSTALQIIAQMSLS